MEVIEKVFDEKMHPLTIIINSKKIREIPMIIDVKNSL